MLRSRLIALCALMASFVVGISAQVVTYEPDPLYDNSENVVVYFHADQGSKGLANLPSTTPVYAHVGLITSSSSNDSDWKYATTWGQNLEKYKMTYVSPNLYKLTIGNIKTFFGVTSASEVIKSIAFVFRDASGNKTGKAAGDKDIFIPVISTALQMDFQMTPDASTFSPENATIHVKFTSNQKADRIWIAINGVPIAEKNDATEIEADYTFTEVGAYLVYGNLTINGKSSSKGRRVTFVNTSEQKDYPGGVPVMGAHRQNDGSVIFCFAAPEKLTVELVGSWNSYQKVPEQRMYYQDYDGQRYFWTAVSGLDKTSRYFYYYSVDEGTYNVGDPYARLILDPSNDAYIPSSVFPDMPEYPTGKVPSNVPLAVYQDNINDFAWTDSDFTAPNQTDLVIYELLFRDFTGTEGRANGNGTVAKALEKLPYLKQLGVNAIELLPINEFNGNISWGYNPNFYFAPDKAYGTPDDYKNFINICHENGIAVILDLVFNQTDWLHPWYRMYPVGSNPLYNADAPHAYSVLNDINQGHPLIRKQWQDVVKYWLTEYHVDGFRFDLVKGLGDNNSYTNSGDAATNAYNASRVANMRAIQQAMNEVKPGAYFINENLAGAQEENEMAQTGMLNWANVNSSGIQYAKGYSSNSALNRMLATKDSRTWGSTVAYLESHDEQRLAYEQQAYGAAVVKNDHAVACRRLASAAAQMILVPGSHMIWMFSEMGNAQSTKNSTGGNNVDPKIVNWNLLDDPDNYALMRNYAEMISIRLSNPDLFSKDASYTNNCSGWSAGRYIKTSAGDKELICAINPETEKAVTVNVPFNTPDNSAYFVASASHNTTATFDAVAGTVDVAPNSYVVLVNSNVASVEGITPDYDESGMNVYVSGGELCVDNAQSGIMVYDFQGICRYKDRDATSARLTLPQGLYIVRSGSKTAKVRL